MRSRSDAVNALNNFVYLFRLFELLKPRVSKFPSVGVFNLGVDILAVSVQSSAFRHHYVASRFSLAEYNHRVIVLVFVGASASVEIVHRHLVTQPERLDRRRNFSYRLFAIDKNYHPFELE